MIIYSIPVYILIFFIYSFAGWFMESVGGIFKEKRFINRGFLIGPYCPVYGFGVVLITILLQKYTNDVIVLFFLAILICGTLEYATSYFMEKFFNARWWDYSKNKFNINGRICLETLLPFGIAGSLIICVVNPFIIKYVNMIPENIVSIISYGLLGIFILDSVVSFIIINGFKNETYAEGDNTEEMSNKVKEVAGEITDKVIDKTERLADKVIDKTEDVLMKASSDVIVFSRRLKVRGLKFERRIHKYTSKKMSKVLKYDPSIFTKKLKDNKKLLEMKIREGKLELDYRIKDTKNVVNNIIKESKNTLNEKVENFKISSEEFTKQIKSKVMKKSIFHRRLLDAFPNLKANVIIKEKDKTKKEK